MGRRRHGEGVGWPVGGWVAALHISSIRNITFMLKNGLPHIFSMLEVFCQDWFVPLLSSPPRVEDTEYDCPRLRHRRLSYVLTRASPLISPSWNLPILKA